MVVVVVDNVLESIVRREDVVGRREYSSREKTENESKILTTNIEMEEKTLFDLFWLCCLRLTVKFENVRESKKS